MKENAEYPLAASAEGAGLSGGQPQNYQSLKDRLENAVLSTRRLALFLHTSMGICWFRWCPSRLAQREQKIVGSRVCQVCEVSNTLTPSRQREPANAESAFACLLDE